MTDIEAPGPPLDEPSDVTQHLVYRVDSVEKTEPPGPGQGQNWYRYILKNQSASISGLRSGTHQQVSKYAAEFAEQLNTRIRFGPSIWNPRGRKPRGPAA